MIERYTLPKMGALFSEEARFRTWLDIEVLVCEAWYRLGFIPKKDWENIQQRAQFKVERIKEREKVTKHDVAAFVDEVQSYLGESGRYFHFGLTSSDVIDTALHYTVKQACLLVLERLSILLETLKKRAYEFKDLVGVGRTHGIHAEPMVFGQKWLSWYALLRRQKDFLECVVEDISVGKVSGAVGNYRHIPPEVERYVCQRLGLRVDCVSTQVIARDRLAKVVEALALLGSCVEYIVVELRHLQRTEVDEVREGFSRGQKGSSAMPHKRNPISAENLTGLARLLRSYVLPVLENCALWHERDISHSSVERVVIPDAFILADYMLWRLDNLLSYLEVNRKKVEANLGLLRGVVYSQAVLLALCRKGVGRDEAYREVQRLAHRALDKGKEFKSLVFSSSFITRVLSREEIESIFSECSLVGSSEYLYKKVFSEEECKSDDGADDKSV